MQDSELPASDLNKQVIELMQILEDAVYAGRIVVEQNTDYKRYSLRSSRGGKGGIYIEKDGGRIGNFEISDDRTRNFIAKAARRLYEWYITHVAFPNTIRYIKKELAYTEPKIHSSKEPPPAPENIDRSKSFFG